MKRLLSVLLLSISIPLHSTAQDCSVDFVAQRFRTTVERNVEYTKALNYRGVMDTLRMNVWKPVNDGLTERPVIIFAHGGGFMGGHRNTLDSLCRTWASRGYVAATISYRLGFFAPWPKRMPYTYDRAEVVRAACRATMDMRTAIRFLKGRAAKDRSSTEDFFVGGFSAGGITALHATFMDKVEEIPVECGEMGMVYEKLSSFQRPDLGVKKSEMDPSAGDASVKACLSFFGALLDTKYVDDEDGPALFTYHQVGDPVVGCGEQPALWGLRLEMSTNYPKLHGACDIDDRADELELHADRYQAYIHQGPDHAVHDGATIDSLAAVFLAQQICPRKTFSMTMPRKPLPNEVPSLHRDNPGTHATDSAGRPPIVGIGERWLRRTIEKQLEAKQMEDGIGNALIQEAMRRWTESIVEP
ncbi:MAG: alpha/beta hydrolase [Flavobacteriales bacterium]|nr:alpha/beta hydrolase [Flavobacteriales bacterium]